METEIKITPNPLTIMDIFDRILDKKLTFTKSELKEIFHMFNLGDVIVNIKTKTFTIKLFPGIIFHWR